MTLTILLVLVIAALAALLYIAVAGNRDLAAENRDARTALADSEAECERLTNELRTNDLLRIDQARRANAVRMELAEEKGLRIKLGRRVIEQQKILNAGEDRLFEAILAEVDQIEAADDNVIDLFREQLGKPSQTWMGWDA